MKTLVNALSSAVRRAPWIVIAIVVVASMAIGAVGGNFQPAEDQNESFAPDAPELVAAEKIDALFSTVSRMQVLVKSESGDVITIDGLAASAAIDEAVRSSDISALLVDQPEAPAVIGFMAPVGFAVAEGRAEAPTSDAEVKAIYTQAYGEAPADQRQFVSLLLPAGTDPTAATADTGIVVVTYESSDDFDELADRAVAAADAILAVDLPPGMTVEPFNTELIFGNSDDFNQEIIRLFVSAGFIIITVLAAVYLLFPRRRISRWAAIGGFVALFAAVVLVTLPSLAAIFPDTFPSSIADWETAPVLLAGIAIVALVFLIWSVSSGRLRRAVADTMLTIVTIFFAISWMNGFGYLLFEDQSPMAQILPILLIGLGVDYAIHITSRYREGVAGGARVDDGVSTAIKTVGVALALATVTTSVGFLTNVTNELPALREFGVLAAIGIVASFLLALTFVPAVREVLDRRAERNETLDRASLLGGEKRTLPRVIGSTSVLATRFAVPVVVASLVLGLLAGWATFTRLETKFNFLDFVPTTSPLRDTAVELQDRFDFPETTQVLVDEGDVATAEAWNSMLAATQNLTATPNVVVAGGFPLAQSPVGVVARLADPASPSFDTNFQAAAAASGLGSDLVAEPDADIAALYAAAFEAAPAETAAVVHRSANGTYDAALFSISTQAGQEGASDLRTSVNAAFIPVNGAGLSTVATSQEIVNDVVVTTLRDSQTSSLLITLVAALVLLTVNFLIEARRPMLGVITTLPVVLVVLLAFAIMAALGIPFGPVTATIAALAIGIGIPYMIHITHRYQEDRVRCETSDEAIKSTLTHTGGALAGSAVTTIAGFGILVVSSTIPFRQFGFVTAYTILLALLGAVTMLPSYLYLWDRWHRKRGDEPIDVEALEAALETGPTPTVGSSPSPLSGDGEVSQRAEEESPTP